MTQLEALQKKFINLRFGTFIHFNSATFQFHNNPDIIDWEYDHENGICPGSSRLMKKTLTRPLQNTASNGQKSLKAPAASSLP